MIMKNPYKIFLNLIISLIPDNLVFVQEHFLVFKNSHRRNLHYLDSQNSLLSINIDFSRAFNTVKHDVLLRKLQHYGIRGIYFILFIYYFFYILACSACRLSSRPWWSALACHGAGNFVYSGSSYAWLMLPPGTHS